MWSCLFLFQVRKYLHSKSWETRIAASQAVEAIAKNVKKWDPPFQPRQQEEQQHQVVDDATKKTSEDYLSFDSFDITQVSMRVASCSSLRTFPLNIYGYDMEFCLYKATNTKWKLFDIHILQCTVHSQ